MLNVSQVFVTCYHAFLVISFPNVAFCVPVVFNLFLYVNLFNSIHDFNSCSMVDVENGPIIHDMAPCSSSVSIRRFMSLGITFRFTLEGGSGEGREEDLIYTQNEIITT